MKRTIPLLITTLSGFILIVAYFIPATQSWGEVVSMWFNILAAIAFLLGGGNLVKAQLKKISDRKAGWGYAAVTLVAFLATLIVGLFKLGVDPARQQEFYGESFAPLPTNALPEFSVPGALPDKAQRHALPPSVRAQFRAEDDRLVFRGWLRDDQLNDLLEFDGHLEWRAAVEQLADAAAPPDELRGILNYHYEHNALAYKGWMSPEQETALGAAAPDANAAPAIEQLLTAARKETSVPVQAVPPNLQIPDANPEIRVDGDRLVVLGPLTPELERLLRRRWAGFPIARAAGEFQMLGLLTDLHNAGDRPLNSDQVQALPRVAPSWSAAELRDLLNTAGLAQPQPKTNVQLLEERNAGVTDLQPMLPAGESVALNTAQLNALDEFARNPEVTPDELFAVLREAGPLTPRQAAALRNKLDELPTVAEMQYELATELLAAGPLNREQIDLLLEDYRNERRWRRDVAQLAAASHVVKYPWSGQFDQQGSAFNWLYEYAFKPLTATMFALLAFFIASAAFRAFRAKNIEAILLLGTAFIILLGRTFAGVLLTSGLPEWLAFLRIENLTVEIMRVFNTAGSRAIMIGIALGLAATSLRILLGVDRSHLGGGDD